MSDEHVWVIDDDSSIRWVLEKTLRQAGMQVNVFESADEALELVRANALPPDAIVSDIRMPGSDGLSLLRQLKSSHPETPVLIMTAFSDLDSTVAAFEGGAFEYIPKPFDVDDVIDQVRRACALAPGVPRAARRDLARDGPRDARRSPSPRSRRS